MRNTIPALARGLLAAWLCWLALPAAAATVSGLYETEVPVTGEDVASRNQAIGEALTQVLVKLTGRDPAPDAGALAEQAPRYVQQYRYLRRVSPDGEASTGLWVRFDKLGLDRALRQRGLPLWGENRPGVLVWLGTEQQGRRQLVAPDADLAGALLAAARDRGLPVQWPLLDLQDQARLTTADLWSDYAPVVRQASARYDQPLVLTGRLRQVAPDHWEGRWTLYEGEGSRALTSSGADGAAVVSGAIAQLADLLAARYAPAGGGDGPAPVRLKIVGVRDVAAYAQVLELVAKQELVDQVRLRSADRDSLVLEVLARGGRDALAQVLDLTRGLSREPDPLPPEPRFTPPSAAPAQPGAASGQATPAPVVEGGAVTVPGADAAAPEPQPEPVVITPAPVDLVYRATL